MPVSVREQLAAARRFSAVYSQSKRGKSILLGRTYVGALWIANARGLQGLPDMGVVPKAVIDVLDLDLLLTELKRLFGPPGKINVTAVKSVRNVVVDDLSILAQRTYRKHDADAPTSRKGVKNAWYGFQQANQRWQEILDYLEVAGLGLGVSGHERYPDTDREKEHWVQGADVGGFKMPSVSMGLELPKVMDCVYRMVENPLRAPWPVDLWTNMRASSSWSLGERRTILPKGVGPPSLAEIYRASGQVVPRAPEIEPFAEEWVERYAAVFVDRGVDPSMGSTVQPFIMPALKRLMALKTADGADMPLWGADWILQESLARAEIRQQQSVRTLAEAYGLVS